MKARATDACEQPAPRATTAASAPPFPMLVALFTAAMNAGLLLGGMLSGTLRGW